jgi:SAM-dependent methyltransferase
MRILDYGCGSGEFLTFARGQGHEVVGLDPSVAMAKRAERENPNVLVANHAGLLANYLFDAVVMNLVLSCVDNSVGALSAASSFSSRLIVTVPHPCFSLFDDLHCTTQRRWISPRNSDDERELYFCRPIQEVVWDPAGTATNLYHRSLTELFEAFRHCQLHVVDLFEPLPVVEGACIARLYDRFTRIPAFMLFDLHKE